MVSCPKKSIRAIEIHISEKNKQTQNQTKTQQNKKKLKSQNKNQKTTPQCNTEMSLAEEMKVYFAWHKNREAQGDVQNVIWLDPRSFQLETRSHIHWKPWKDF